MEPARKPAPPRSRHSGVSSRKNAPKPLQRLVGLLQALITLDSNTSGTEFDGDQGSRQRRDLTEESVALVASGGIDGKLNATDRQGVPILHYAVQTGQVELVAALLTAGAKVDHPNKRTKGAALMRAVSDGHRDIVECLLAAGAEPDLRNDPGETALIHAAKEGELEIARILLKAGADPGARSQRGATAMSVLPRAANPRLRSLLERAYHSKMIMHDTVSELLALHCVGTASQANYAELRGCKSFVNFLNAAHPAWSLIAVLEDAELTAASLAEVCDSPCWLPDVAHHSIRPSRQGHYIVQLEGQRWSIVTRSMFAVQAGDIKSAFREARALSLKLEKRAIAFSSAQDSQLMGYIIFEEGVPVEHAECQIHGPLTAFDSKVRERPTTVRNGLDFVDRLFGNQGLYLPVCYPESDGYTSRLVLVNTPASAIRRADFVGLPEPD